MNPKISVVINTFNEERNIRNCLECLKWADEIVVVDMHSDDRTAEIAREYTDKVFMHERLGFADPARQFALEKATGDWVFSVDADELVPLKLRDALLGIARADLYDVVMVSFQYYFFGCKAAGNGWGAAQTWVPRFFKKGSLTYASAVHDFTRISNNARVHRLMDPECAIIHLHCLGVERFLDKVNLYTTIEARQSFAAGKRLSVPRLLFDVAKEFARRFVWKKGYRDGFMGLAMAMMMVSYRFSSALKLYVLRRYGVEDAEASIQRDYEALAARIAADYSEKNEVEVA